MKKRINVAVESVSAKKDAVNIHSQNAPPFNLVDLLGLEVMMNSSINLRRT